MQYQLDRNFYRSVHELINLREGADASERRGPPRHAYRRPGKLAPLRGGELPPSAAFRTVECRDLSVQGFSFFAAELIHEPRIVVRFQGPSECIDLVAEILHQVPTQENGPPQFCVGCRFVGRWTSAVVPTAVGSAGAG